MNQGTAKEKETCLTDGSVSTIINEMDGIQAEGESNLDKTISILEKGHTPQTKQYLPQFLFQSGVRTFDAQDFKDVAQKIMILKRMKARGDFLFAGKNLQSFYDYLEKSFEIGSDDVQPLIENGDHFFKLISIRSNAFYIASRCFSSLLDFPPRELQEDAISVFYSLLDYYSDQHIDSSLGLHTAIESLKNILSDAKGREQIPYSLIHNFAVITFKDLFGDPRVNPFQDALSCLYLNQSKGPDDSELNVGIFNLFHLCGLMEPEQVPKQIPYKEIKESYDNLDRSDYFINLKAQNIHTYVGCEHRVILIPDLISSSYYFRSKSN